VVVLLAILAEEAVGTEVMHCCQRRRKERAVVDIKIKTTMTKIGIGEE